jgi:EmrB/QacA subfamily drug resistance transporter
MPEAQERPGYEKRWIGLLFIGISLIVISLDNTVVNVALPSIARELGASSSDLQWIVDAYILVFAALLLTMGGLGDRLGRKKLLQFGLVLFGLGSLAAALSPSTTSLLASRAFLGIGGATIMPSTLSIVTATFPDEERSQAIAIWAAIFGLGIGIGPVVGGWLLESYAWNSVFFINLPVVAVALIGDAFFLAESKDEHPPKPDVPGVVLSITGLFALVYGIIQAGHTSWGAQSVWIAFGVAAALLAVFAWWENRNPDAMLPLRLFENMSFTGANTALAFVTFSLFGSIFFLSQYLQTVLGYTALETGIRLLPLAFTLSIFAALSSRVADRLGVKITVALGIFIAGCGLLFMSRLYKADTSFGTILLGQLILAIGMGIAMSPATNSIMGSVPVRKAGIGSAMNDTTRQLGGALGVALLGSLMNHQYLQGVDTLKTKLPQLPGQAIDAITSGIQGAHQVAAQSGPMGSTIVHTADQAFVNGIDEAMLIGAIIMGLTALLTILILPSEVRRTREDKNLSRASAAGR